MKNLTLNFTTLITASLATGITLAEVTADCNRHLRAATEANEPVKVRLSVKAYEDASCVKKPTPAQIEEATIEGLAYMLYLQSKKRGDPPVSTVEKPFRLRGGPDFEQGGQGSSASQIRDYLLNLNTPPPNGAWFKPGHRNPP